MARPLVGLLLLAAFHLVLERPLVALLPPAGAGRVWPAAHRFPRPGPGTAVRVLPGGQDDLRELGSWSPTEVAQYAAREFAVEAATALGVAVALYAVAWHLRRGLAPRPAARRAGHPGGVHRPS
ncbi:MULTISPECIES: hypothetical protein [unclassified Modestobacter]